MRIEITQKGVFDQGGKELEVGFEMTVEGDEMPAGLLNKCRVLGKKSDSAELVTNPVKLPEVPAGPVAIHKGGGSWSIMNGEVEVEKGISKEDAESFNGMSAEDKAAYIAQKVAG